jgi:hypothetical protein
MTLAAQFDAAFQLPQPDRSPIYQWARRHVDLPESYVIPGKFNVDLSPHLRPIFDALQDDSVRTVTVSKSIQSGGTLIADVWVPWLIVNQPGPISWTMHTDDMVSLHAKTRLNPILDRCAPVARLLPRAGPMRTTTEIYFGNFFLVLNAANLSDQQSQSIRFKINDEIWHPKWQNIYSEAIGRVTRFEEAGTSKVLNISQGGWENDVSDTAWQAGHMAEWSAACRGCGELMPLNFRQFMAKDDKTRAGVVWNKEAKRDDGTFNETLAGATARFRCPHCGHEHDDTDSTREHWRRAGAYVVTRPDAPTQVRSFHFEALVSRPMRLLAEQFCIAENEFHKTGSTDARRVFRQKREARAWVEPRQTITIIEGSGDYNVADYAAGQKTPGELHRFMAMDRQKDHRWVEIGAYANTATGIAYRQLFFGRVDTKEQARLLQQTYLVPDTCVVQDRRYEPQMVDAECLAYGWRGMEGVKKKTWTLRNEATNEFENYPHSDPLWSAINGQKVPYYQFSGYHCKDIVSNAVAGHGFKWIVPRDVNPLYLEHLKAEEKKEIRPGVWEWIEVKQNQNHGFDTSAMMVAVGIIAGLVRFTLEGDA